MRAGCHFRALMYPRVSLKDVRLNVRLSPFFPSPFFPMYPRVSLKDVRLNVRLSPFFQVVPILPGHNALSQDESPLTATHRRLSHSDQSVDSD